jgi:hypothetical protein
VLQRRSAAAGSGCGWRRSAEAAFRRWRRRSGDGGGVLWRRGELFSTVTMAAAAVLTGDEFFLGFRREKIEEVVEYL